jgi:hypothetical protein
MSTNMATEFLASLDKSKDTIATAKAAIEDIRLLRAHLDEFEKLVVEIIDACEAAQAEISRLSEIVN